ncbi:hypothetical protein SK128_000177 [Halocaridina rubra]|uniref:SET domain-containing protein n=1 Tax=Halocaridina rubra TaxID=373956 RepID=A0AAN9A2W9_HALRR
MVQEHVPVDVYILCGKALKLYANFSVGASILAKEESKVIMKCLHSFIKHYNPIILDGPPAVPGNHPVPITRGIFPRTLLLKHSCNPSAFTYNYENKMVTRAIAFIPAGEQVTIPYIVSFEKYSKNQRVDILKRWGGISCSCEACLNDWPIASLFLSELVHFKCPKCSIVVKGNSCIHCDINYQRQDYDGDKKLMVAKWNCNCYQFQQLSNEAKISFSNIFKYQISKEDFGNLSRFLEFLEKHVEIPCLPYILIRQHMCMYFLRE